MGVVLVWRTVMSGDGKDGIMASRGLWGESEIANLSYLKCSSINDLAPKCRHACACEISLTQAVGIGCGKGLDALTSS